MASKDPIVVLYARTHRDRSLPALSTLLLPFAGMAPFLHQVIPISFKGASRYYRSHRLLLRLTLATPKMRTRLTGKIFSCWSIKKGCGIRNQAEKTWSPGALGRKWDEYIWGIGGADSAFGEKMIANLQRKACLGNRFTHDDVLVMNRWP
jgi:hypothetical protein